MKVKVIHLGEVRFNADWLVSVTEKQAVKTLTNHDKEQVINAWKIANGFSVPKFDSSKPTEKKVKKMSKKTPSED